MVSVTSEKGIFVLNLVVLSFCTEIGMRSQKVDPTGLRLVFEPCSSSPSHMLNLAWEMRTAEMICYKRPGLVRKC